MAYFALLGESKEGNLFFDRARLLIRYTGTRGYVDETRKIGYA